MTTPPDWTPPPAGWQPQQEDTVWAVLAHLSIFAFALLGPLVIYLVKRDSSPFSRYHAAEALNFHISLAIYGVVFAVLILLIIGIFLLIALAIAGPVLGILAAIAAGRGETYRYPFTIRFVH
jgi:uncharacterized Tic20 family protein